MSPALVKSTPVEQLSPDQCRGRFRPDRAHFKLGAPPTFLEEVGANQQMRDGRLTSSRKVGDAPLQFARPCRKVGRQQPGAQST